MEILKLIRIALGIEVSIQIPVPDGTLNGTIKLERSSDNTNFSEVKTLLITEEKSSHVLIDDTAFDEDTVYYYRARIDSGVYTVVSAYIPNVSEMDFFVGNSTPNIINLKFKKIIDAEETEYAVFKKDSTGLSRVEYKKEGESGALPEMTEVAGYMVLPLDKTVETFDLNDYFLVFPFKGEDLFIDGIYVGSGFSSESYSSVKIGINPIENLSFTYDSDAKSLLLGWDVVQGSTGYEVFMLEDGADEYTSVYSGSNNFYERIDNFVPGLTYYFKVVSSSPLGEDFKSVAMHFHKIPTQISTNKKIIDVSLGEVDVTSSFEGLTMNTAKFKVSGKLSLLFINTSVIDVGLEPKLFRTQEAIQKYIDYILDTKTSAEFGNDIAKTNFFTFVKTLKMIQRQMDGPIYLCINYGAFATAINEVDFQESIAKRKDIKFVFNLSDTDDAASAKTINDKLSEFGMVYFCTDTKDFSDSVILPTIELGNYLVADKNPEQVTMRPQLITPYASYYNMYRTCGVSNNYFFIPTKEIFDSSELDKIKNLLNIEPGINVFSSDLYSSYLMLNTAQIYLTKLSSDVYKKYNGKIKNSMFAWENITYNTIDNSTKIATPYIGMRGLGEKNKNILDDYSGFHMTSVVEYDGKMKRVLMKNENDYLLKDLHVFLGCEAVNETAYKYLELAAKINKLKTRNISLMQIELQALFSDMKKAGTIYDFKIDNIAKEEQETGESVMAIYATFYFEVGTKVIAWTNTYYF